MFVDEADYLQSMITEFEARCQQPTYADRRALQLSSQSSIDECDIENEISLAMEEISLQEKT